MPRARTRLEPGERLLLAAGRTRRRSCPHSRAPSCRARRGDVLALLARSSAPHAVRVALDLLAVAFAARAALRFTRAVWQWDRTLLALTTRRVFVVAPRGAMRRAWQTMTLAGVHGTSVSTASAGACSATARSRWATGRRAVTSAS